MKNNTKYMLTTVLGLFALTGISVAEEDSTDRQDIIAACTAESKGAIDVQEYIDECVKEKEAELNELAKEAEKNKEKG